VRDGSVPGESLTFPPERFSASLKNFFLKNIKNKEKSQNNLNLLENRTKLNDLPQIFDLL